MFTPSSLVPPIFLEASNEVPSDLSMDTKMSYPPPGQKEETVEGKFDEFVLPVTTRFPLLSTLKLQGSSLPLPPR
jgi:hypothetical protein